MKTTKALADLIISDHPLDAASRQKLSREVHTLKELATHTPLLGLERSRCLLGSIAIVLASACAHSRPRAVDRGGCMRSCCGCIERRSASTAVRSSDGHVIDFADSCLCLGSAAGDCLAQGNCERQASGQCGFTVTPSIQRCLDDAPKLR